MRFPTSGYACGKECFSPETEWGGSSDRRLGPMGMDALCDSYRVEQQSRI